MEPLRLPPARGIAWLKQGGVLFFKTPFVWLMFFMSSLMLAVLVSALPVIGTPLIGLLTPIWLVTMMVMARMVHQGEVLDVKKLTAGLQLHAAQLVTIGGIVLVCQYLIFGVLQSTDAAQAVNFFLGNIKIKDAADMTKFMQENGSQVMFTLLLLMIVVLLTQFAPMLVYFHKMSPVEAVKVSTKACLYNIGPIAVYLATMLLIFMVASLLPILLTLFLLLGVLQPIVIISAYASYDDIFPQTPS